MSTNPTTAEVWMRAWCAAAMANSCSPAGAAACADVAVSEYVKRFQPPETKPGDKPPPPVRRRCNGGHDVIRAHGVEYDYCLTCKGTLE